MNDKTFKNSFDFLPGEIKVEVMLIICLASLQAFLMLQISSSDQTGI
jgi:hypothetical protein